MKQFIILTLTLLTAGLSAVSPERLNAIHDESVPHYHDIQTYLLKEWIQGGKSLTILDARTPEYDDGNRLPGALFLPYTSSDADIAKTIPAKDATVIVYCTSKDCPASKFLVENLLKLGYTNVYKYPEGINAWIAEGNPIEKTK